MATQKSKVVNARHLVIEEGANPHSLLLATSGALEVVVVAPLDGSAGCLLALVAVHVLVEDLMLLHELHRVICSPDQVMKRYKIDLH